MKKRPDDWSNPYREHPRGFPEKYYTTPHIAFEAGADALFDAGYRPVPNEEEILSKLHEYPGLDSGIEEDAKEIHRWLLEGD